MSDGVEAGGRLPVTEVNRGRGLAPVKLMSAANQGIGPQRLRRRGGGSPPVELVPDALTAPAGVSYDSVFEGVETKGLSVEEEALIAWQDVLDMVVNGRPNEVACPYCNHRPLTIEEVEQSTRISCSKCGKFIQGRFTH
jgi:hypothetical protein